MINVNLNVDLNFNLEVNFLQSLNSEELIAFVLEHKDEDPIKLLLQQKKYPDVDMALVAQQIEGQRQASVKWPTLAGCQYFLYPPRLNREQSSSEETAFHKADIIQSMRGDKRPRLKIADLTGGMGIDSIAFAKMQDTAVDYVECNENLCRLMEHNAKALGLDDITVHYGDGIEWLRNSNKKYDILFIDPARRDTHGKKVSAFEDCTPNILEHHDILMAHCEWLMVKASPMMDIDKGAEQLGNVSDAYVVAVDGECKEVLFICGEVEGNMRIHCQHLHHREVDDFVFTRDDEASAQASYAGEMAQYLYEPNAALMKGGAFKLLSQNERLSKLAHNTHLYTSERFLPHFPGRRFKILAETRLTRKEVLKQIPDGKAHVVTRNYPVAATELQKQLGLKEGGDLFVIATTIGVRKSGFICCEQKNY